MNYKLKSISREGIAEANSKAELYRFLNEPEEAESICRDILATDPADQLALRQLGLAITDQFTGGPGDRAAEAESLFRKLTDPYEREYYEGLLHERRAKAQLRVGRSPHTVFVLIERALRHFENAEKIRPAGNDDSILRWNRCIRLLQSFPAEDWQHEIELLDTGDSQPI